THLKRKLSSKKSYPSTSSKGKEKGRERPRKDKSPKGRKIPQGQKLESTPPTSSSLKSSSMKCFKCLGKGHIASQ
ncbi:hypothetical protein CR513_45363, partial [Mucuna pruriens]